MSYFNLTIGGLVVAGLLQLGVSAFVPPIPPIVVHSLNYSDGHIFQDRTITSGGDYFPAEWRASIMDPETRKPVPGCSGSGFWPYPAGRKVAKIELSEWVGSEVCTVAYLRSIGPEFYPVASWHYGNDSTMGEGVTFKP